MNNFQKFIFNRTLAEALYDQNIDLQPFIDKVESGNFNEEQVVSEFLNTAGKVIGAVGGGITRGVNSFMQGAKTGYNWANPKQQNTAQPQQPNTAQPQQPNTAQPQQNQQQLQQRQQVVNQLQQQFQQLQNSLPELSRQLQALAQMG